MDSIYFDDNLEVLRQLTDGSIPLIIIDPPFNTGKRISMHRTKNYGDFVSRMSFSDSNDTYYAFMFVRLLEAYRVLASYGTLYVHLDYREVHYIKVMLDGIFGRECFLNEIIWAYDYGARTKRRWPAKHDTILMYVKNPEDYEFDYEAIDRIPYMSPGLQTPERAALGKTPTDTWWHTIVPTSGKERTGYPTQKPLGIVRRMILASSQPGETVLDFFAGSGTTGVAAVECNRHFILVDNNLEALIVMRERFGERTDIDWR